MFRLLYFIVFSLLIIQASFAQKQKCIQNLLTSKDLGAISQNVKTFVWKGNDFGNLLDVTITKSGNGPNLLSIPSYESGAKGIWIGKNNQKCDSTNIVLQFSKTTNSLSFIISAINNDKAGFEKINNISVFDSLNNEITDKVNIKWVNDSTSGFKFAKSKATVFNQKIEVLLLNQVIVVMRLVVELFLNLIFHLLKFLLIIRKLII